MYQVIERRKRAPKLVVQAAYDIIHADNDFELELAIYQHDTWNRDLRRINWEIFFVLVGTGLCMLVVSLMLLL